MSYSQFTSIGKIKEAFGLKTQEGGRFIPEVFVQEMRLAAAVKWYEVGMISQSKAAEIAGVSRHQFLEALNRYHVSPFQVTAEELAEELARE